MNIRLVTIRRRFPSRQAYDKYVYFCTKFRVSRANWNLRWVLMFLFRDNPLIVTKEIRFALKNIYGVGLRKAFYLCSRAGIGFPVQLNQINEYSYELMHVLLKRLVLVM